MPRRHRRFTAFLLFSLIAASTARAQWAVVDAPAIAQLVQEVQAMQQQIATARLQLQSAEQSFHAITGDRGMALLQPGASRNYLPSAWPQLAGLPGGRSGGEYAGLSAQAQTFVAANSVLSPLRVSSLSSAEQQYLQATRQWGAIRLALAAAALSNSSARFASIQNLISSISAAGDQKAILDLQARISGELGMLQNEQTKLQVLEDSTSAEQGALRQQAREQVVAGHGRFESRFRPQP
jgi:type IV secretion system protein VirB5